jgi:hypothetical protein
MPSVCIICHQERAGHAVADTTVIRAIRSVKATFGWATNNRLVVCSECLPLHAQRRKAYERKQALYALFGLGLVGMAVGLPLLTGAGFNPISILFMILLAALVAALALLDYLPPTAISQEVSTGLIPHPPPIPTVTNRETGGVNNEQAHPATAHSSAHSDAARPSSSSKSARAKAKPPSTRKSSASKSKRGRR